MLFTRSRPPTSDPRSFSLRRSAPKLVGVIVGGLFLLLMASLPAGAHRQSISFAWVSQSALTSQVLPTYYAHNDAGGAISLRHLSTGRHEIRFYGLADATNSFGHAQVTAYGSSSDVCQVRSWSGDFVYVACFDAAGTP